MVEKSYDFGVIASFGKSWSVLRSEPAFPLSGPEKALVARAPFKHTPGGWKRFGWTIHDGVLYSYGKGEVDFRRMMEIMRACSLGCQEDDRVEMMALTADRALRLTPRSSNRSSPPYPAWQRQAVIDLVLYLEQLNPNQTADQHRAKALQWLRVLGLDTENATSRRTLSPRTLQRWVHEHRRSRGEARPAGRPTRR